MMRVRSPRFDSDVSLANKKNNFSKFHDNNDSNVYRDEKVPTKLEGTGLHSRLLKWMIGICALICTYSVICINTITSLEYFVRSTSISSKEIMKLKGTPSPRVMYLDTNTKHYYNHLGREIKKAEPEEPLMKDQFRNSRSLPLDDSGCVPMKEWQTILRPACNNMHEISMTHDMNTLLGIGGWRLAWKILKEVIGESEDLIVLKTLNTKTSFDEFTFYQHFVDAAVSDRLSSSKYILDVYGFCGQSILNEFASTTLEDLILHHKETGYGNITAVQKAVMGREVALALEEFHDVDGNVTIVNKDLKPSNIFVMKDGSVKLGDFNLSELLRWNVTGDRQCMFRRKINNAVSYRSPEEAREELLTETIDIYSLGSILYKIITGSTPYYKSNQVDEKHAGTKISKTLLIENQLPTMPLRIRGINDTILLEMVDVMNECHTLNEGMRPRARDIAKRMMDLTNGVDKKIMFDSNQI